MSTPESLSVDPSLDLSLDRGPSADRGEATRPVRVLVVDDAAFMRRSVIKLLAGHPDIEVVGEAGDGEEAVHNFADLRPDVICLDIDMPKMNGITAMKHIMSRRPTPIVVVSSMTDRHDIPFEVLRLGVVGFFPKPTSLQDDLDVQVRQLLYLVRSARWIRRDRLRRVACRPVTHPPVRQDACRRLLAVAGTLGSVGPLLRVFALLSASTDPGTSVLFKVPLPSAVTESFLESIGHVFGWEVVQLDGKHDLRAGVAYFVPPDGNVAIGERQIVLSREPTADASDADGQNPRLDEFFLTVADRFGADSTMMLLAGHELEGIAGLRAAAERGARCFIQDEATALFSTWHPEPTEDVERFDFDSVIDLLGGRARPLPALEAAR